MSKMVLFTVLVLFGGYALGGPAYAYYNAVFYGVAVTPLPLLSGFIGFLATMAGFPALVWAGYLLITAYLKQVEVAEYGSPY